MMNRCYTTTNKDYPSVGGRGIRVCERWHTYENFLADMGEKPPNSRMARTSKDMNFTPGNAYWLPLVDAKRNRLYGIWKGIRRRCGAVGPKGGHKHYAGRNIVVCPEWADSFHAFAEAVGQPPSDEHTIDRIDNNRGYVPGNVRWAAKKEQANNRSDNVFIEMDGERRTLQQWCEVFGVDRNVVSSRWHVLFKPASGKRNRPCEQLEADTGKIVARHASAKEAANTTGVKYATISKCLSGGNETAGGFKWRYAS
jgi:hypothetical protein